MYYISRKARSNSRSYGKLVCMLNDIADVITYMQNSGLEVAEYPYIFTYIKLSDGSIIQQNVTIGGRLIPTSPLKLREALDSIELNQKKLCLK